MRIFTKEWYILVQQVGMAELFEPVIDKEYSDEEFEQLYQEAKEMYIEEERAAWDEPPFEFGLEDLVDDEDFDPEDYLIGDIDEWGETQNLRHPLNLDELLEYERRSMELEWHEYENRESFDEDEAAADFDEEYQENLAEPDRDIPAWIRETVDPRLVALWRLPEGVYKKLMAEDDKIEEKFEACEEAADEAVDVMLDSIPDGYEELAGELDELDCEYVTAIREEGGAVEIEFAVWGDEDDNAIVTLVMDEAEVLENEKPVIEVFKDEDGDIESTCELANHEIYFEDGAIEVHLLLDDGEPKYLTVRCSELWIKSERLAE